MRSLSWVIGAACLIGAAGAKASAQEIIEDGPDDRIKAVNAIFRFRNDLNGDSTHISRCRLGEAGDSTGAGLDEEFRRLFIESPDSTRPPMFRCSVMSFAHSKRVLWLDGIVEVRRDGFALPPYMRKEYDITFQLILSPSYKELHRYVVAPGGIETVPSSNPHRERYAKWRVTGYTLAGWDFDWAGRDGSASVRRPALR
jgi:hypothetical protein